MAQGYLGETGTEEAADEILVSLDLVLDNNGEEVGLGVHVACHVLDLLYLQL